MIDFAPLVDLHTHTIASDHASGTWRQMAEAGAQKGLQAFAVTEHGPSIARAPHIGYFANLSRIAPRDLPIPMLYGVEDDLIDREGRTALPDEVKARLDIVLLGTHCFGWARGALLKDVQRGLLKAMENPLVKIISHPVNPWYPLDFKAVAQQSLDTGTALEFNLSKLDFQVREWRNFLDVAAEYRVPLVIGSDSHEPKEIGFHRIPYDWLADIAPEQIKNRDLPTAQDYFHFTRPDIVQRAEELRKERQA